MAEDRLPTELTVAATIRLAAQNGVSIFVLHKGDPHSGVIIVKVNLLDRTAHVLSQIRGDDDKLGWTFPLGPDPLPEPDADRYMARQTDFDPDIWTLEIEDKEGRLWFEGKILSFPSLDD